MGLAVEVGMLAGLMENDEEGAEEFREELAAVNRLLVAEGLPPHDEPTVVSDLRSRATLCSFPYDFLHYLRRAHARRLADPGWHATPLSAPYVPFADPLMLAALDTMTSHLICHSDAEGFYVPIDFPEPLASDGEDLPGGVLGSSQRLLAELVFVAPALGIVLSDGVLTDEEAARIAALSEGGEGLFRELAAWLALYEAARLSVAHKTAIVFA